MPDSEASHVQRMAFFVPPDLSESELARSIHALEEAGIRIDVISVARVPAAGVSAAPSDPVSPADYSALALSGAPDGAAAIGTSPAARDFLRSMQAAGKPILYVPVPGSAVALPEPIRPAAPFSLKKLFAQSWQNWNAIDAPRLGAALAYYTLLSLAPLLVLVVSFAGVFFRRTLIASGLLWQVRNLMGDVGTKIIRPVLENSQPATGIIAGVLGMLTLLVGASGVFLELRDSLDTVWEVKPPYGSGLLSLVRERLSAFLMVLGTGLILSVSLFLTTLFATPVRFLLRFLPSSGIVSAGLATCVSLVVMTLVFALIFKVVPDIHIRWSDVWIGAVVTAALFTAGKWLIALYLSKASIGSAYAAAGSLVIFLTWVYYSVQIFLFGAEFTHEYTLRHGSYSHSAVPRGNLRRMRRPPRS
ncbi:MAG TPA: YhjD/YihY/BrkB family envelope integrity protein [Bryobacteraceae bacterium]|nr:YhjD/YihY/BrkB family envelope integrity protein [Bryobacteraceae bacterium]